MYSFASYSPGKQTTISKSQQEQEKAEADLQRCEILQLSYKIHYFQRSKDYWENICREQNILKWHAAAAAKLLQLCPTLCDPIDRSPPGSPVPGILKARTLEWVAISFSNAWKWKVKVKSLNHIRLLATPWTAAYQALPSIDFSSKSTGLGCHCLLSEILQKICNILFALFTKYLGQWTDIATTWTETLHV